jgi:hypothetical protein
MTYTINGKEYTEFEVNERCAEIMDLKVEYPLFNDQPYYRVLSNGKIHLSVYEPTTNPVHAWPIIQKCWDKLMLSVNDCGYSMGNLESIYNLFGTKWDYLIEKHNCTKLAAACICFIEINEGGKK